MVLSGKEADKLSAEENAKACNKLGSAASEAKAKLDETALL